MKKKKKIDKIEMKNGRNKAIQKRKLKLRDVKKRQTTEMRRKTNKYKKKDKRV